MTGSWFGRLTVLAALLASAAMAAPPSGKNAALRLAVDPEGTLTGYYQAYAGWDEAARAPRFSCAFYIYGRPDDGAYRLATWLAGEAAVIHGRLHDAPNQQVVLKLEDEPGGCWNVERFSEGEGAKFTLLQGKPWIAIRLVAADRAYFHAEPDRAARRGAYVVRGDVIGIHRRRDGWVLAEFENERGRLTRGWILETELFDERPPAGSE